MAKQPTTQFQQEVFDLCRQIPPGQVATYGQLGNVLARRKAKGRSGSTARAVGQALKRNPFSFFACDDHDKQVPCHRVVSQSGAMTGYLGKTDEDSAEMKFKLELLRNEGAITKDGKIVGAYFQEWKEK